MSTAAAFTLPWGRFHATPWDRNVNEGVVEWPPSPWRLLRALFSAWKVRRADLAEADVLRVIAALAVPPHYFVPPFCVAHTRHYLPGTGYYDGGKARKDTAKTFDPFVATARDAQLVVEWDVDLDDRDRDVLQALLVELAYLGRAESLVDARVIEGHDRWWDGESHQAVLPEPDAGDITRLLAPTLPLDVDALTMTPLRVRGDRRLEPPSTRWVNYTQPVASTSRPRMARSTPERVTAVRFAIIGRSPSPRTAAVGFGDVLRQNCLRLFGDFNDGGVSATLGGKGANGEPADGRHDHAHYLAFGSGGLNDRMVDSMVVWAPGGLDQGEVLAVARTLRLQVNERIPDADAIRGKQLGLEAFGPVEEVAPELCGMSSSWTTYTPYAMSKHWRGPLERQLTRDIEAELGARGIDATIEYLELRPGNWLDYRRHRLFKQRTLRDSVRAHGFEVGFSRPLKGPLALGALGHFGLGLLLPA